MLKEGLEVDGLIEMYTTVHAAIRTDPSAQLTEKNAATEKKM
jgi:large subunit ribosomal protein L5e